MGTSLLSVVRTFVQEPAWKFKQTALRKLRLEEYVNSKGSCAEVFMRSTIIVAILLLASPVVAQQTTGTITDLGGGFSMFHDSTGRSGTITDLGGGFQSYQDNTGVTGNIMDLGGGFKSYSFTAPPVVVVPPASTVPPRANFMPPAMHQPLAPPGLPPQGPSGRSRP